MSDHVHQLHHQKEAIYEVSREEARQGYSSSYFLVTKPGTSEMRPVLNLKRLNWFTRYQKFKMESLLTVRKILRKRDFLTKVDLSDAYMHVPVHPAFQKYLQFEWEGRFYRFRCLPFGLQSAPRVFTKLVRQVVEDLRRKGVRLVFYLDDFLVLARSKAESVKHTRMLVQSLKDHGFFINEKKSVLEPSFQQEFLGAVVDSESMEFRVPKKKLKKFLKEARRFLRKGEKRELLTVRQLAGLIGKLQSLAIAMDQTRLRLAGLLQAQREATRRFTQGPVGWERKVLLTEAAMADLTWWVNEAVAWNGKTLLPLEFHKTVYTDASDTGYGGVVLQRRKFSPKISHRAQGFWNESEQQWSINLKEMEAVRRLLLGGVRHLGWKNMNLEVFVDNMATLWYLNKAGGSVPHLTDLATLILRELAAKNIRLVCRYVNTKDNVIADRISRWKNDRSDWMLHPRVFRDLIDPVWGPHTVDWTATRYNSLLPRFCSWGLDPHATYVDVLKSFNRRDNGYCNPPFSMIHQILNLVRSRQGTVTLIAPVWQAQPWWPDLLDLCVDFPILLPRLEDLFLPPQGSLASQKRPDVPSWEVAAWRVSFSPSARRAFQRRLSILSSGGGPTRLFRSMSRVGLLG